MRAGSRIMEITLCRDLRTIKTMNVSVRPNLPLQPAPAAPLATLQHTRLQKSNLSDALSKPAPSGIQNEDIYRSMVIGAGIGGVSGAISSLFNEKASLSQGSIVGATGGAINGAVVGVITRNSDSKSTAMFHSALASAGIGAVQNLLVGKTDAKGIASGLVSGAFRGAVVSYQLYARGEQRTAQEIASLNP